ncbi:MAG: matrixin family metalloprotease [Candidatus Binatia bacterium]
MPDTAQLLAASDTVVLGHVTAIRGLEAYSRLRTAVTVAVEQVVKGPQAAELIVVEPGGFVGRQHRWIYGAPTFFLGERVLLFLHRNPRSELETTFLGIGKFRVVRSSRGTEFAVRNLTGVHALAMRRGRLEGDSTVTTQALSELLQSLRALGALKTPAVPDSAAAQAPESALRQANFTFAGPPLVRWFLPDEGEPIAYRVSTGGDGTLGNDASVAAVDAALAAWSSTGCASVDLVDSGTVDPAPFSMCDGRTAVTFNDPFGEIPDPAGCTGVLGVGGVCWDSSVAETFNGATFYRVTEGDVMINNGFGDCPFWNDTNVAELLTHEVGHTLGLGHSSNDPNEPDPTLRNATMYYAAHFDGRGAQLMSDDVAAVCALYPVGHAGSVTLRRFAIVSDATGATPSDRLVVDGTLNVDDAPFDPKTDTLTIDLLAAGTSVFRLAVSPEQWTTDVSGTRYYYSGMTAAGTTTLLLSNMTAAGMRFTIRARDLDLSGTETDPVVIAITFGESSVTQPIPPLRNAALGRVYP